MVEVLFNYCQWLLLLLLLLTFRQILLLCNKLWTSLVAKCWKQLRSSPIDFPTDSPENVPTLIFFYLFIIFFFIFFFFFAHKEKKIHDRPWTIPVFIYAGYIICLYQFSDIVGLDRSFIYFEYGCTLTSQLSTFVQFISKLAPNIKIKIGLK